MASMGVENTIQPASSVRAPRVWSGAIIALALVGIVFRLAPLLNQDGRLLREFPTEDGYLMLTIARNIAIGQGMSTAAGTIPTNGTQPGVTLLWAGCYWLTGGDKVAGIALIHVLQTLMGAAAALVLYRFAKRLLANDPAGPAIAALTAAVWFAAPFTVGSSQNCLETGAYVLSVLLVVSGIVSACQMSDAWSLTRRLVIGVLLGVAFWARNDAALLILAVCVIRMLWVLRQGRRLFVPRLYETIVVGGTATVVASPWLIFNWLKFGHVVPISGRSEAMDAVFAGNLHLVAPKLVEYLCIVGGIPHRLEDQTVVLVACVLVVLLAVPCGFLLWRRTHPAGRIGIAIVVVYGIFLASFYGLFFGAGHFMSRYLFPLSPFLTLLTVATVYAGWRRAARWRWCRFGLAALASVAVAALLALNVRTYLRGKTHMHFQVVNWVAENVPEDAWVAAPQSGTLGYYHDRTINLDGKVNPEALRARGGGGVPNTIPEYIVANDIQYLADWVGLAGWVNVPLIQRHFELIVREPDCGEYGLAVFKRRSAPK